MHADAQEMLGLRRGKTAPLTIRLLPQIRSALVTAVGERQLTAAMTLPIFQQLQNASKQHPDH